MGKRKKRILVVSNMYPSKKHPHYGIFVKRTVEVLRGAGYTINVVSLKKRKHKMTKLLAYIGFYGLVVCKGLFGKYGCIYAHYASHTAVPLLIIRKIRKTPIVMNVHGNDVIPETEADEKYTNLVRNILNKSDLVIAPSEYFKNEVKLRFGVEETRIKIYPSGGVDTEKFHKIEKNIALNHMNMSDELKYIGYVSRIEEKKGWELFLTACCNIVKDYSDIRLIVVGDGQQIHEYSNLVKEIGLDEYISKYELLSQDELLYVYNLLDVFVFPTYRKSESLGLVGLEAMACETVAVLPDRYGPSSYAADGMNSYVFKTGDADSLEKAIRLALDCNNSSICKNARKTAFEYNHDNSDRIIIGLMNDVLNERKGI